MEVIIRPSEFEATTLAARLLAEAVQEKQSSVLGLATGRTMESVYPKLVDYHRNEGVDFSLVRTFNLDEYIGLPPEDKNSYRHYMNDQLFDHVNIDKRNTFLPDGMTEDLDRECSEYEQQIQDAGGIDIQLLGIGRSGHIGFNESLSALRSRTRAKALTPVTIQENSTLFDNPEDMPRRAITMGVGTILEAKKIILLVTGLAKAEILAKAVEGPVTSMVSASAIQLHPRCLVICCAEAAKNLEGSDYYNWIFENEPEWEPYR